MTRSGSFLREAPLCAASVRVDGSSGQRESSMYIARYFGQRRRSGWLWPVCSNERIEARRRSPSSVSCRTTARFTLTAPGGRRRRPFTARSTVVIVVVCTYTKQTTPSVFPTSSSDMTPLAVILVVLLACHTSQASICPHEEHEVCNNDIYEFRCTCAISLAPEPAREQSCNGIVDPNDEDFAAASVTFNLDESASHHEEFPEARFRDAVANAVRVDKASDTTLRRLIYHLLTLKHNFRTKLLFFESSARKRTASWSYSS